MISEQEMKHRPDLGDAAKRKLTVGEYRVGITFNPSQDARVDLIKMAFAHAIDQLEVCKPVPDSHPGLGGGLRAEQIRLIEHAQQLAEDAAMNGVKAVTKRPHDA